MIMSTVRKRQFFDQKTMDMINATRMILTLNGHSSFLNEHSQDYSTAIKKVTDKDMSLEFVRADLSGLVKSVSKEAQKSITNFSPSRKAGLVKPRLPLGNAELNCSHQWF